MESFDENIFEDLDQYEEMTPEAEESSANDYPDQYDAGQEQNESTNDEDFVTTLLRRGGVDRNAVRMQGRDGMEEVSFDSLTNKEKLSILDSIQESPITDDEINMINYLRQNNLDLRDFAQWQRNDAVQNYINNNSVTNYSVNQISDEDLYKFDLMEKYPNMTDDELDQELYLAQTNEALFAKKIQNLRSEYAQLEDQQLQQKEEQARYEADQQYQDMAIALTNIARNTSDIHDITIEDEEKEDVLSFLLDRDANGQSGFYKLFENPEALFKLAWYAKYGDQAFAAINDYYKGVIEKSRRSSGPKTVRKTSSRPTDAFDLSTQFKNIR